MAKRVLLTGVSGSGKSTVTAALAAQGFRAVDLDTPEWSHWVDVPDVDGPHGPPAAPGRDWAWREDRVERLLTEHTGGVPFVSGCAENMRRFLHRFDLRVLLFPPRTMIRARLAQREPGSYGARAEERLRVMRHLETVEPLLRRSADLELDTDRPVEAVVERLLRAVEALDAAPVTTL
ncbi:MAG TPA: shikimate kinase [Myxococcota bacterium]